MLVFIYEGLVALETIERSIATEQNAKIVTIQNQILKKTCIGDSLSSGLILIATRNRLDRWREQRRCQRNDLISTIRSMHVRSNSWYISLRFSANRNNNVNCVEIVNHDGELLKFSNSNWTEWSTIRRFEITSTITPWIVRHRVQLLINLIYTNFGIKNVFWEALLCAKICSSFHKCWKLCETLRKKPLKRAYLTCKSRGYPITDIQLQKVQIGHL